MTDLEHKVMTLVSEAAVYVPESSEGIRIDSYDIEDTDGELTGSFVGTGEETGECYKVFFAEVDLKADMFYKLILMDNE